MSTKSIPLLLPAIAAATATVACVFALRKRMKRTRKQTNDVTDTNEQVALPCCTEEKPENLLFCMPTPVRESKPAVHTGESKREAMVNEGETIPSGLNGGTDASPPNFGDRNDGEVKCNNEDKVLSMNRSPHSQVGGICTITTDLEQADRIVRSRVITEDWNAVPFFPNTKFASSSRSVGVGSYSPNNACASSLVPTDQEAAVHSFQGPEFVITESLSASNAMTLRSSLGVARNVPLMASGRGGRENRSGRGGVRGERRGRRDRRRSKTRDSREAERCGEAGGVQFQRKMVVYDLDHV